MKYSIHTLNEFSETLQKIDKSIVSIKRYAQFDFKLVKKMIDKFKKQKTDTGIKENISRIIVDLQYIDIYYQKLTHIQLILEKLKKKADEELLSETQKYPFSAIISLNEMQFEHASNVYINSTNNITDKLNNLSKMLTNQDEDYVSKSSLYSHNNKILDKATSIGSIYFKSLNKILGPTIQNSFEIKNAIKECLKVYTMQAERDICAEYLKVHPTIIIAGLSTPKSEEISLF